MKVGSVAVDNIPVFAHVHAFFLLFLQEFMFDIDATPIDPELLDFTGKNNLGKSGGRGLIYSQERGRYIKPMIPRGKVRQYNTSFRGEGDICSSWFNHPPVRTGDHVPGASNSLPPLSFSLSA